MWRHRVSGDKVRWNQTHSESGDRRNQLGAIIASLNGRSSDQQANIHWGLFRGKGCVDESGTIMTEVSCNVATQDDW